VRRHDDAGRTGAVGAAADRPQVARIGDPIEHREQGLLRGRELVGVGITERLDQSHDSLVIAGIGPLGQLAVGLELRPGLGEPVLRLDRPLGRPELEHLSAPAQHLADGAPAVDEIRRHCRGTS